MNHLGRFTAPWEVCSHRWGRRAPTRRVQRPCPRVEGSRLPGAGDTVSLCNRGSGQVASFNQCLLGGLRSSTSGEKRAGGAFVAAPCTQMHSLLGGTTFLPSRPWAPGAVPAPPKPGRVGAGSTQPACRHCSGAWCGSSPGPEGTWPWVWDETGRSSNSGGVGLWRRVAGQKEPRLHPRGPGCGVDSPPLPAAWLSTDLLIIN